MGAELFNADGRTDMKLIVTICNFTKAHKNEVSATNSSLPVLVHRTFMTLFTIPTN